MEKDESNPELPPEVLSLIFVQLKSFDLFSVELVCKSWQEIVAETIWKVWLYKLYHRVLTSLRKLQKENSNFHLTTKTLQTKPKKWPKLVIIFAVVGEQNFQFIQQRK